MRGVDTALKVLMVNKFLYPNGGSETYIFKIGEYLQAAGHQVEYFGMQDERNIVGNKANAHTMNMNFHSSKFGKLLYPAKIIYSKEARKQIRKVLDSFHPDVVHLNNINFQITPSIIYEIKKDKLPVIWTAHDYQLICPNHMLYNLETKKICEKCLGGNYFNCSKERCIHGSKVKSYLGTFEAIFYKNKQPYRMVDRIICPSSFLEKKLLTNPVFSGKTTVIHNFIDDVMIGNTNKQNYVLYFGRYSEEKGIRTLLEAAKKLPEVNFTFAGKGPLENEIQGLKNVKNVGFTSGKELEELIRKAKFSVYTSEWYENCPFSVMESQMYGTPVIGADIGGIPELIEEGKTGLLFKSGDVEDLVRKIELLWKDERKLKQFQEYCKDIHFDTVSQYCNKLLDLYSSNCSNQLASKLIMQERG